MRAALLGVYAHMPAPARSLAASIHGLHLNAWRYGPESDRLEAEAREREQWSAERWRSFQEEQLASLLDRAARRVPFYRRLWQARRARGDRASWELLPNWPVLTKAELRARCAEFVADDRDRRRMFHERTSGTTGTPLDIWWSRRTMRAWFALHAVRVRSWHGASRHEPWAILGGQPVVPAARRRPPFWVWNRPMRQLYLSSNHVSAANAAAFADAMAEHRVTHLITYTSSAVALAQALLARGAAPPPLRLVTTNAEPLLEWQRRILAETFGCPVRETYGMAEAVAAASECQAGALHLWPEVGVVELVGEDGDTPVAAGTPGRVIATGLLNEDMPLIRYEIGDRAAAPAAAAGRCACGRTLPTLSHVEGRTADVLTAPDGRAVFWINPVFYGLPVYEAQVVQATRTHFNVRYVPGPGFGAASERAIASRLRERLGDVQVAFEPVTSIPRGANGKFKPVVCAVPELRVARGEAT
jgi:phenylacetate-CoA ligase